MRSIAVLWSCQRVVRCVTVSACFTYLTYNIDIDIGHLDAELARHVEQHGVHAAQRLELVVRLGTLILGPRG